jgi:hypothetical protein
MKPSNTKMYNKVMRLLANEKDEDILKDLRENEDELMEYLTEEMPEEKSRIMIMIKKGGDDDDEEELFPLKSNPRMPKYKRGGAVKKAKKKAKPRMMTKWESKWG